MKATAPPPLNPTGTDKKMVAALLKKQIYDHNENPSSPPPLSDKKMVVALLKIMIHEYLFVVSF